MTAAERIVMAILAARNPVFYEGMLTPQTEADLKAIQARYEELSGPKGFLEATHQSYIEFVDRVIADQNEGLLKLKMEMDTIRFNPNVTASPSPIPEGLRSYVRNLPLVPEGMTASEYLEQNRSSQEMQIEIEKFHNYLLHKMAEETGMILHDGDSIEFGEELEPVVAETEKPTEQARHIPQWLKMPEEDFAKTYQPHRLSRDEQNKLLYGDWAEPGDEDDD